MDKWLDKLSPAMHIGLMTAFALVALAICVGIALGFQCHSALVGLVVGSVLALVFGGMGFGIAYAHQRWNEKSEYGTFDL